MKRCPTCKTEYPDDATFCRFDGGKLEVAPAAAPKAGSLTMGWDAVPDPEAPAPAPAPAPAAGKAGSVSMAWDAVADPTELPISAPAPASMASPAAAKAAS